MPTRTARTTWTGGLQDGTGTVALVSSGVGSYEVSFPRRAADDAGGVTASGPVHTVASQAWQAELGPLRPAGSSGRAGPARPAVGS